MAIRPPFSWAYLVGLSSHWHGAVMSLPDEQIRQRVVNFSQARIANAGQATKQPDIKPRRHRRTPAVAPGRRLAVQDCRQPQGRKLLQITVADPTRIEQARTLIGEFLSHADGKLVEASITPEAGRVTAPLNDPSVTADLLIRLRDNDIRVDEITVSKPSLDEVFFALTGHGAESDTTDTEESAA